MKTSINVAYVDEILKQNMPKTHDKVLLAMEYSLFSGGKRFRPMLLLSTCKAVGKTVNEGAKKLAAALEFVHTYSLIHDDLPEMDNDDYRRGKPSNHKVFGVGNAVLAGDGLLNTAHAILLGACRSGPEYVSAAEVVNNAAGIYGMIAGQSADLLHEKDNDCNEEILGFIYRNKTAKMLTAPLLVPSVLAGGKYYSELKLFGENIGCLFQLTDDILDVEGNFSELGKTIGKDSDENKCTAIKLYGLDGAKLRADVLADKCYKILEGIEGDTDFFKQLVSFVLTRKN